MSTVAEADGKGLEEGLNIPDEIGRREDRLAALASARAKMEKMYMEHPQSHFNISMVSCLFMAYPP